MHRIVLFASVVVACAGTINTSPPSFNEDLPVAHHEQAAADDGAPATYQCGDTVLEDQVTSGGVRVTTFQPCWDFDEEREERAQASANREDREVREDRHAERKAATEVAACLPIVPGEREHSPFVHRKEIAEIVPHREGSRLRGVWIMFKPVAGLTADWLRNDIACQHARWVQAGKDPRVMTDDPTLVEGADVQVFDRGGHVEVLVTTDTEEQAEIALARAHHELPAAVTRR